jgi:hypothetical protein
MRPVKQYNIAGSSVDRNDLLYTPLIEPQMP